MANKKKTEETNTEVVDVNNMESAQVNQKTEDLKNDKSEVQVPESKEKTEKDPTPSPQVLELLRLYPQYEKVWVTPNGFVHPENAPAYCRKGAKLYTNKFYNKNS